MIKKIVVHYIILSVAAVMTICQAASAKQEIKTFILNMNVVSSTCATALVSNVRFNRQLASDIIAGTVSEPAILNIDCSAGGVKPNDLTFRLTPERMSATQGNDGVFQVVGREDVGYKIMWGDNSVGSQGVGIPIDTVIHLTNPINGNNNILFSVMPIALNGSTMLASGDANTYVIIKLTYS